MAQEEKLQASALAMFAENLGIAEEFGNALDDRHDLIPADERVEARTEIRFCGESSGNAQGESNFRLAPMRARDRGQADVVDLRIRAPGVASGDGDLELARQVVELGISREQAATLRAPAARRQRFRRHRRRRPGILSRCALRRRRLP